MPPIEPSAADAGVESGSGDGKDAPDAEEHELSALDRLSVLESAYEKMGVASCCGDHSAVGTVAELGFEYGQGSVFVEAGPFEFVAQPSLDDLAIDRFGMRTDSKGHVVLFACGPTWYLLSYLTGGAVSEVPIEGAIAFRSALGCE